MKQTILWGTVTTLILFLLTSDAWACGNAMKDSGRPLTLDRLLTLEMFLSMLVFIAPFFVPWLMGKAWFYIQKIGKEAEAKDRRKLMYFSLVPWIPLLIISALIWWAIVGHLLRVFWGYRYDSDMIIIMITIGYIVVTLLIYKVFHLTPFNKK